MQTIMISIDERTLERALAKVIDRLRLDNTQTLKTDSQKLITITQACNLLDCSVPTLRKLRLEGRIPYMLVGRKILFDEAKLLAYLEKQNK